VAVAAVSIRPALARALAELALVQACESYHASLEYGRNTEPQYGLYYLGAAHAQRGFVDFLHALPAAPAPPASSAPQLRSLRQDIDALQSRLLAAYRPPASIERHGEFIVASAALKEAREQDAAGHRQRGAPPLLHRSRTGAVPGAGRGRDRHRDPGALAVHVKHLRPGRYAGRERGAGVRRQGAGDGRYAPVKSEASHARFRADLARVIALLLAGRAGEARALAAQPDTGEVAALPALSLTDLDGRPVGPADLADRVVLVDFWATWCPPCRGTLAWLGRVKEKYGDRVVVLALAVESDEAEVRELASTLDLPLRWAMRTPDLLRAFGDVSAVPTLLVFDQRGQAAGAYYGSTRELHEEADARLAELMR
jgi:thiol-disulfide isomerase/thioredoxin